MSRNLSYYKLSGLEETVMGCELQKRYCLDIVRERVPQTYFAMTEDLTQTKAVKVSQMMRLEEKNDVNIAKSTCQIYVNFWVNKYVRQ